LIGKTKGSNSFWNVYVCNIDFNNNLFNCDDRNFRTTTVQNGFVGIDQAQQVYWEVNTDAKTAIIANLSSNFTYPNWIPVATQSFSNLNFPTVGGIRTATSNDYSITLNFCGADGIDISSFVATSY
jgi:hypothetical protein